MNWAQPPNENQMLACKSNISNNVKLLGSLSSLPPAHCSQAVAGTAANFSCLRRVQGYSATLELHFLAIDQHLLWESKAIYAGCKASITECLMCMGAGRVHESTCIHSSGATHIGWVTAPFSAPKVGTTAATPLLNLQRAMCVPHKAGNFGSV